MAPYDKGARQRADDRVRHANGTPAARSSKHRGFRAADPAQPRQKQRWDAEERRGRASQGERPARPNWEPRDGGQRRDDRGGRGYDRDDRGGRRFDRDDRAPRRFDRDDRAPAS